MFRRIDDELLRLREGADEQDPLGAVNARIADDVAVVRSRAPVGADRRERRIRPFHDRRDIVVDRDVDRLPRFGLPFRKDRRDAPANAVRRPEQICELADEVDAEVGGHAPSRLFAVEKPRRVLGPTMRKHRVRGTHAPDRLGFEQALGRLDRRAAVERERHEDFARALRRLKDAARVRERGRDRFLAEHVLSRLEAAYCDFGVARMRRRDDDGFDFGSAKQRLEAGMNRSAIFCGERCARFGGAGIEATQCEIGRPMDRGEIARARNVATADDGDPDFLRHAPSPFDWSLYARGESHPPAPLANVLSQGVRLSRPAAAAALRANLKGWRRRYWLLSRAASSLTMAVR